jgi:hypothetical protein
MPESKDLKGAIEALKSLGSKDYVFAILFIWGSYYSVRWYTDDRWRFVAQFLTYFLAMVVLGLLNYKPYKKKREHFDRREKKRFEKLMNNFNIRARAQCGLAFQ